MKYRIKKKEYDNGITYFCPQYRYDYIPIWCNFMNKNLFGKWYKECYTLAAAKDFINSYKKSKITPKISYIDIK